MTIIDDAATPRDARQALLLRRAKLAGEIEAGVATRSTKEGGNVMDSAELAADNLVQAGIALRVVVEDNVEGRASDSALLAAVAQHKRAEDLHAASKAA